MVGAFARDTRVERPSLPNNPDTPFASIVTDRGVRSVDGFGRPLTDPGTGSAPAA
ncbi:hypothetical protein [Clavibacter michiganensis]|uniref:hypothetical protein n=1 Tax=Clavibacter michiganensis TaxID=28447 RepID=UPI001FD8672E|nr:hypothetical protein [Clavibacter michiganensis]MDO4065931.1 hypothetical protein [Clavibacter michiganensis]MDO4091048.1 hypothetical protein [Clavibacter michiganensis]